MQKLILILVISFVLNKHVQSQTDSTTKKFHLLFSLGGAKALGNLANQDINNNDAGLVISGMNAKLTFGYSYKKNFGFLAISDIQNYTVNVQAIADYMVKENPGISFKVESNTGWSLQGLLLGVYGNFPINNKLMFEPRLMIGSSLTSSPHLKITGFVINNGITQSVTQEQLSTSSTKFGFTYLVGAGIKYNFAKKMSAVFNIDYNGLTAKQQYNNVIIRYDGGYTETTNFKMSYSSICTTVGIGFRFGKK